MLSNRQLFLNNIAQTSTAPLALEIERAEGIYLYDNQGEKYIDLIAGIGVSNAGHSHPEIIKAIKEQVDKYMHLMVYGEFVETPQVQYAALLAHHLPAQLGNVYFTNSGAEATEGALKLAKRFTGRSGIISFKNAYHGSTHGALSVIGDEALKRKFRPLLPGVHQIEFGNESHLQEINNQTAAVIVETMQAEAGIHIPNKNYMQLLRNACNKTSTLLILDEAQAGLGRTGKLWAFEHFDIVPDILLLAKAVGGGMPLGAFIASRTVMQTLSNNPALGHITTFGGHPVCCAAGMAAFKLMVHENWIAEVESKGAIFEQTLQHPLIKAKRRIGLLMTLEFESFELNKKIIDRCLENGVLTDWFLFAPQCMRIAPPLIITVREIKEACKIILDCLNKV